MFNVGTYCNHFRQCIEKMKNLFKADLKNVSDDVLNKANSNVDRMLRAVDEAKKEFEDENKKTRITELYWNKVEEARKHFEVSRRI